MVLPHSHRIPRVLWYSGYRRPPSHFDYKTVTFFGAAFCLLHLCKSVLYAVHTPSHISMVRFGLFPFRSPLLRKSFFYFLFLRVLRCFSSPGSLAIYYLFIYAYRRITNGEFPHSDICGSMFICNSPQLFAACHVLLRRLVPRHPPYALLRLIVSSFSL